jgi:rhamnosyl/mannosyltransferase
LLSVVHLGKFYPPASGGMETHLQTLARAQADLGAAVRVVCVNHADWAGNDVTSGRFRAIATAEMQDGPVRVTRVGRLASIARLDVCPQLPGRLRAAQRPGVVLHLHTPNPAMVLALVAAGVRVPLVVTHHSDVIRQRALRHVLMPFERLVYRRAARVLATSPAYPAGSRLLAALGDKVETVPLGIDLAPYRDPSPESVDFAQKLRAAHGKPLWLMVGRLIYYKGLDVALRALARVPGKLFVIGTGPLAADGRRVAREQGVEQRVVWHGYAEPAEVVGAYHAATALWFPSTARSEAFGLTQVEAMASGCPVINTAIHGSGVPWVCRHEREGLTVPVGDDAALAAAANRLLSEPGLRDRLGAGGRARATAEFDHNVMARRTLAVYRAVTRPGTAG